MLPLASRTTLAAARCTLGTKMVIPFRTSVVSGPPRNRVSFAEKASLGLVMCLSVCVVPAYVLVNLKKYTAGL